jgi:hypothetical protein
MSEHIGIPLEDFITATEIPCDPCFPFSPDEFYSPNKTTIPSAHEFKSSDIYPKA